MTDPVRTQELRAIITLGRFFHEIVIRDVWYREEFVIIGTRKRAIRIASRILRRVIAERQPKPAIVIKAEDL